ncbi:uncharacterized protein LOC129729254 [Wyeomyia smithii]|uniref:uncharacterized protein LOC129729254 n=1 Tax=Wyeomyia smithii TaxID=174621 RepID=UPI002467E762|nr:uncharacterized protein LOC129729254 [Wyeomyia smithii]
MFIRLLLLSCLLKNFAVHGIKLYDINVVSFEPLSTYDRTALLLGTFRVTRKARNTCVLSGDFEILKNWGNEYMTHFYIENSIGMIMFKTSEPFCELLNSEFAIAKKFREHSTIPPGNYCPLPKNRYEVNNYRMDDSDLPIIVPKDTYTLITKIIASDGHLVLGYKVTVAVS